MLDISKYNRIVFYDGDCGFCNSSVQFILKKMKKNFRFTPLQSDIAAEILDKHKITIELDTIYYLVNGKLYNKSSAALRICKGLKGGYPLLFGFYIIPKFIRDLVYSAIAKRRHKISPSYCVKPTKDELKHFLT